MKFKDKHFFAAISVFCLGFGIAVCEAPSFVCGAFAGAAMTLTFEIWSEDE